MSKYGKLTVIKDSGLRDHRAVVWECLCDCGNTHLIRASFVRTGKVKSCGKCRSGKDSHSYKHGSTTHTTQDSIYNSWCSMKQRCDNPNAPNYQWYGGKGITYQESWKEFVNFKNDMGEKPDNTHIHRLDSNEDYTKDNCVWLDANEHLSMNGKRG